LKLTEKQEEAADLLGSDSQHIMLFGGSRSGKTFLLVWAIVNRALKADKSRHAILRFRFNAVKASIVFDTFPKVMDEAFRGLKYEMNKTEWYATMPNGSTIWFGGLDDKERTEKILGQEYVTMYLNECSQIPWNSVGIASTRLAQHVYDYKGRPLKPRMFYDCNPPSKAHWSYQIFAEKRDPVTKQVLYQPDNYRSLQMNPGDNAENLPEKYLETLKSLGSRLQKRFLKGEFSDATPNALFSSETFDTWRVTDGKLPDFVRVVVSVDPSGSGDVDNADNDAIGIIVAAIGTDGNAYLLEDCTVKAGPKTWGDIATSAYDRHMADVIVGEMNYGGEMVRHVIQTSRPRTPFKAVTATRGKAVRAEPISALYEKGKVRHVGDFQELEDELCAFSTFGYTGEQSPNRADALIWAMSELFPGLVRKEKQVEDQAEDEEYAPIGWMG
jgi:hypothetical protein